MVTESQSKKLVLRHSVWVRVTHWLNLLCLVVLLMSGVQIFNAHPALYWGQGSDFANPWLSLWEQDGLPWWLALPGERWLSMGRRWHFFFAWALVINGAVYLLHGFISRHFVRDLWPSKEQMRQIGQTFYDHLRLRFHHGAYNVLQKLAYLAVIFGLLPLIVLSGMTMSPQLDATFPILLDLFGGRQSARSIHFLCAFGLVAFVAVHVLMVLLSGFWNNLRSMITGRYRTEENDSHASQA